MNNEYGLDAAYFKGLCAREFNDKVIDRQTPKDLARAFARASRAACPEVMHEPEFALDCCVVAPKEATFDKQHAVNMFHIEANGEIGKNELAIPLSKLEALTPQQGERYIKVSELEKFMRSGTYAAWMSIEEINELIATKSITIGEPNE